MLCPTQRDQGVVQCGPVWSHVAMLAYTTDHSVSYHTTDISIKFQMKIIIGIIWKILIQ